MQPIPNRVIRIGLRGGDVAKVQESLNKTLPTKPGLKVDGIFGSQTATRTRLFQHKNQLKPDSLVGPKTWAKMMVMATKRAYHLVAPKTSGGDWKPGQK
ncbi:MAG: peptidoglycan-binding domain-containing protein [Candidatus Thiodiazotropha taylori]